MFLIVLLCRYSSIRNSLTILHSFIANALHQGTGIIKEASCYS